MAFRFLFSFQAFIADDEDGKDYDESLCLLALLLRWPVLGRSSDLTSAAHLHSE